MWKKRFRTHFLDTVSCRRFWCVLSAPSHLQQQHQLRVLDVDGDVERRLVKLTERVHVSSVFDEGLGHAVMTVLRRPVKSRHLQHVFGVDVGAALKDSQS